MDGYTPDYKADYFTKRDYAAKWRNLSRTDAPAEWKGSQLSDTAYAAKEVQNYLQQSLWPDEPSHLAKGADRRIITTKGAYTAPAPPRLAVVRACLVGGRADAGRAAAGIGEGSRRPPASAIDAVAIALTDEARLQKLADIVKARDEERVKAKAQGREPEKSKRPPLETPWGSPKAFRRQVLSLVYATFDDAGQSPADRPAARPIVVAHRAAGRKLTGAYHEKTQFGPVPGEETLFTGRAAVAELSPNHLRLPVPEKPAEAVAQAGRAVRQARRE